MSQKNKTLDYAKATQYLLGDLSDEQAFEFECEIFSDESLSEQLDVVRADLSEKYLQGELKQSQKVGFENHFLTFPANAEIHSFQKSLIKIIQETDTKPKGPIFKLVTNQSEETTGLLSWLKNLITVKNFAIPAFATILLIFLGIGFYFNQRNNDLAKINIPEPISDKMPDLTPTPILSPAENINVSQVHNDNQLKQQSNNNQNNLPAKTSPAPRKETTQQAPLIATIIFSGSFRDIGSQEKPIVIGKETKSLKLHFQYPEKSSEAPIASHKLILETMSGKELWRKTLLDRRQKVGDKIIETVPTNNLNSEQYRFRIVEIDQDRKEETVQSETFFVKRID